MVRNNELNAARRGAADKARARQQVRSQMTGTLVGIDPEDSRRVIVSFDGSEVSVLAGPDRLVPGSLVAVEVDALGAPVRVVGAVTVRPAGLDEAEPAPLPVVAMPELAAREMTEAERQAIIETEQGLADARADLEAARVEAETNFGTLNDKLGQAFPTDIFDVGAALGGLEVDVLAQAALDAQGRATAAQQAAIDAAQDFAAGKISEAELRAANDAQAKANAARDAAIQAAELDATTKAGQALAGAQAYAEQQAQAAQDAAALDALAKATAAQEAAIQAAAEHADLVAQGANADAIAAAAVAAQAMADAAQAAAEAHADAQATAAETAAKTHATNEAARVKQEALSEAAADALSKANAAAQAAQQAAEQYALAQAEGKAGAALDAAKAHAEAQAQAAQDAAEAAAVAHADAARNAAIDAAALTAQTKADVAKQGAIEAAALAAQAMADAAAQAAQQAAEEHADLVAQGASQAAIDAAALDAQAKADAARQSAIDAAALDAQAKADGARQSAIATAATDAQAKADAAAEAAETAAKAYALAQAQGLSGQALADAKADATAKAEAAQQAAITAAATDAQAKANKAKTDAIAAAATDAQAKANAAAQAAQQAAEAYALAQAQGLSGQALADAKADATAKANAAELAAKNAAAADALAKANAARDAAITAAQSDLANLQIGGRNLLTDSLNFSMTGSDSGTRVTRTTEPGGGRLEVNSEISWNAYGFMHSRLWDRAQFLTDVGQAYTLSVDVKADLPEGRSVTLRFDTRNPGGGYSPSAIIQDTNGAWVRHSTTMAISDQSTPSSSSIVIFNSAGGPDDVGSVIQYRNWKLEKGTKGTDWSPAPEDVDAGIADARALATTADGKATTAVTEAGTAKTNAATALSTAQQADTKAGQAVTTAGQADTKAGQAVTTAGQANTKAGQAVTTAGQANTAAQNAVATASAASTTASNAQAVADDALSKYGPLDQRTIDAQAAADAAASAASSAATAAGLAQARADSAHSLATTAGTAASQAMSTADGKNTTSYKTVTTTPGPAPTNAVEGKNRRQFDMHRNRLSNGTIVGEWMWSGTSWVQVHMGDGILRSLDVGKLSAGTVDMETAVVNRLWAELAVVQRLQVEQSAFIDGVNIKDGAVTARTLNVVPANETTGGMELKAQGFRIIPGTDAAGSAGSSISMRSDEATWIDFVKSGVSTFSVGPEGNLIAQTVSAGSYEVDGTPLQELLEARALGLVSNIATISQVAPLQTTMRGLMTINFTNRTSIPRAIKVTAKLHARNRSDHLKVAFYTAKSTTDEGVRATLGSTVGSATNYGTVADGQNSIEHIQFIMNDPGETVSVLCAASTNYSTTEQQIFADNNTRMWAEDIGPWRILDPQVPDLRGGVGDGTDSLKDYTWKRTASWSRSFMNNGAGTYPYGTGRAYQGRYLAANGTLASMIGFPSMTTALNGATVKSVKVKLTNQHAYSSAGVTAYIGLHGSTSAPSSFASIVNSATSKHFNRGQTHTITLPSSYHSGFKNGTYRGITLYINSTSSSHYGYWNGTTAEIIVDYEK